MKIRRATADDCAGIAAVQAKSYRTACDGICPAEHLEAPSIKEQTENWRVWMSEHPADILYVAEDASGTVGYALARPCGGELPEYDSQLIALHVNQHAHRIGTGRHMVTAVVRELRIAGCRSMMLWTPEANPSRGFYERLGAALLAERRESEGHPPEVAYGWPDIAHI